MKILLKVMFAVATLVVFSSQDGWNDCTSPIPWDEDGTVEVTYYDPDGDCWSNEWTATFYNSDGTYSLYDNNDWEASEPSSGGWYDFDGPNWDCCNDDIASGGGGGGGIWRDCVISFSGGVFTIECATNAQ